LVWKENIEFVLKSKDGKVKQLFQLNRLGLFLKKLGLALPNLFLFGRYTDSLQVCNLVTNAGMAGVASRINGSGAEAAFTYIGIGTGATAANAADTTLEAEITTGGGARASGP